MLSRWVPLLQLRKRSNQNHFKRRLARNVLLAMLLASLFPLLIIGTLSYYRSRTLLLEQASQQIHNIVTYEASQTFEFVQERNDSMNRLVSDERFNRYLMDLLKNEPDSQEFYSAKSLLFFNLQANPLDYFDRMIIMRPDGSIAFSTDEHWLVENFPEGIVERSEILKLMGTRQSVLFYSPTNSYTNKMVLLAAHPFLDEQGKVLATAIAFANADPINEILVNVTSFVPGGSMFYFTNEGKLISVDQAGTAVVKLENPHMTPFLRPLITDKRAALQFETTSFQNVPVIAYAEWLPDYNMGIVMEVSITSILRANNIFNTFNLMVLAGSLLVAGTLIYFSTRGWVNPLVHLSKAVDAFSQGQWEERSKITRSDEIGLLAHSFNNMADQLSELYHSLEGVVERRTRQLRIASEVAQLATSTTRLEETLGRTVQLIAERFGFYHVAIHLIDETGRTLILREASGTSGEEIKKRGDSIPVNASTLIGWVAAYNEAKIISNVSEDPLYRLEPLLPDTQSEVAIPISLGSEVLGVIDFQSTLTDAFDEESIAVFQTLANQISSTLQISRLLESTQVSYQETSLLYRTTRQVTQARSEAEIVQGLTDTFIQLPYICSLLSVEGENFKIQFVTDSKSGRVEKSLQTLNIPVGRMAGLLTDNRVVHINDITRPSDYENLLSFLLRRGCKTAALISVLENGRLSKVIALGAHDTNLITHTSLQPYANLAEVIGASLEKYRVLYALQQRLAELQILASFSQAISAETDLNKLYHVLHQQVIQTLGSDLDFLIAIYSEETKLIEMPYIYDNGKFVEVEPFPLGEGLTSVLINERKPLLLPNQAAIQTYSTKRIGRPAKSWMGAPLIFAGRVVGAIVIQDQENENRLTQDDLNLFMTLAPQIATAVRNTQLYTETQEALLAYEQERFLLNTLLSHMPEQITFKDPRGKYIRVSNSFATLYNTTPDSVIGKTDFDLMQHELAETIFREEQKVMNLGKAEIGKIQRLVTQTGEESWAHISRIPVRTAEGDPYGLLIIERNVTELKKAEALAQRRAGQVTTAAEIARDTTGTLEVETLLQKSVSLVRERFGFYHASIFLLDETGEYAVLRESTGLAGQQMMKAGHRLAVGSKSIVGQVTGSGHALIVNNVNSDPTHLPNPLLPDTHSELAIPLKTGSRVLGALDVQSTQTDAFSEEDVNVLNILADQLAVALINGELFAKAQELLGKHRLLRQITVAASTTTHLEDTLLKVVESIRTAMVADRVAILMLNRENILQVQASSGYTGTKHLEIRVTLGQGITGLAAQEKRAIRVDDALNNPNYINLDPEVRSELAIPILFSDELIGVLNLESVKVAAFDENDQEILGALGNNLGGVIANIRLVHQVRQQVVRERQLFDVTSKIRTSVDMETILQTSTKEICRALGARRARIEITAGQQPLVEKTVENPGVLSGDGLTSSNGQELGHPSGHGNGHKNDQEQA